MSRGSLAVTGPGGHSASHDITADVVTIGRGSHNTIVLAEPTVSHEHARIEIIEGAALLVDLGSRNGTRLEDEPVTSYAPLRLADGARVRIGPYLLTYRVTEPAGGTEIILPGAAVAGLEAFSPQATIPGGSAQRGLGGRGVVRNIDLGSRDVLTIGRDASNDVDLDHPQVSRFHARIERRGDQLHLIDLGSTNGTFVNGRPVRQAVVHEGDLLQIGPFESVIGAGRIATLAAEATIRVEAVHLSRRIANGQTILNDISLEINPREFVAVVGASGSGKSTLVNALSGYRPATSGQVLYNGHDLYRTFDAFRTSIGYVPQDDIIHRDLTVYKTLDYAAQLRLPPDTTPAERERRVTEVLADLHMSDYRDRYVDELSGGQRKRMSIGVELLTRPPLFFLDEPTSGLDPATETHMMRLMRELADQGRTLILVTHATQNILLCDRVIILSRGGHLAFFGSPQDALSFFGVDEFVDIYDLLEEESRPGFYADRRANRPTDKDDLRVRTAVGEYSLKRELPARPVPARAGVSRLRQISVLTRRYLSILLSPRPANRKALATLLLQAPVIAILIGLVFPSSLFSEQPLAIAPERVVAAGLALRPPTDPYKACGLTPDEMRSLPPSLRDDQMEKPCGDARKAMLMLFLLVVVAIWLGTSNAAREIVKELPIYQRERMVTLKIAPYLVSKLLVLLTLALIQTALLLAIVMAFIRVPVGSLSSISAVFGVVYLAFVCATLMGLLVSTVVASNDEAGTIVPILLIPQIIFAGAMLAQKEMGYGSYLSPFVISRWSWEALGAIVDIPRYARAQGDVMLTILADDKWKTTFDISPWHHAAILGAFATVFLAGAFVALKRKDSL